MSPDAAELKLQLVLLKQLVEILEACVVVGMIGVVVGSGVRVDVG